MIPLVPATGAGRYAPSPTGDLHLGNLRTALLAWLFARSSDRAFLMRMEDLDDRVDPASAQRQLTDLAALGIDWDGPVLYQSHRQETYQAELGKLLDAGLTFECFCTRREIHAAASAPHAPPGSYPGTCRDLTEQQRAERRATGRPPAVRLRTSATHCTVSDALHGRYTGVVDDFVIQRGDGTFAYNFVCVVDDLATEVDQVVRGDDLLSSAPRQAYLASLLGHEPPRYAHVPLVLGPSGKRLAKRDGAVTMREIDAGPARLVALLARSLGLSNKEEITPQDLLGGFDPALLPHEPWTYLPGPLS
ncbi:tRNA glutamyl-Q(34) synthetase GluQRS [Lolliginicoccus lacisalsi]|uniref:tRNA glutamyl-Q(34) synthetase GluQRS n=1 Tax=Lolliginicoccus lacisalsi TaxID=2742202 RepID=UPI001CDBEB30|nr:tRNA glutamyl-Q(34) synthetase GluQRS [Lolliginicoccus lacisalsi]